MPRSLAISVAGVSATCLVGAWDIRVLDERDARRAWDALAAKTVRPLALLRPAMIAGLPAPAPAGPHRSGTSQAGRLRRRLKENTGMDRQRGLRHGLSGSR